LAQIQSALISGLTFCSAVLVIAPLGLVFFHVLMSGIGAVNLEFFTNLPKPVGVPGGGMANAIVGTLELLALAVDHWNSRRRAWGSFSG
jgi:phosphate transport system permease protein